MKSPRDVQLYEQQKAMVDELTKENVRKDQRRWVAGQISLTLDKALEDGDLTSLGGQLEMYDRRHDPKVYIEVFKEHGWNAEYSPWTSDGGWSRTTNGPGVGTEHHRFYLKPSNP